ncbi:MAG: hypothetical protein IPH61_15240 [Bacteroidetes bacterium]|nr:hypothetical protein [Bacteroidota bacterium]
MIDNSLMTTMPDAWGINQDLFYYPINKWGNRVQRANVGRLSCDQMDYYNSEIHTNEVYLPVMEKNEPLYIGFFIRVLIGINIRLWWEYALPYSFTTTYSY